MKNENRATILIFLSIIMILIPNYALGEWFGDIYLGIHSTEADENKIQFDGTTIKTLSDSDTGSLFGGRIGYWFESCPWLALAIDASVFQLDFDEIDVGVAPVSTLLMVRLPLHSSQAFPRGKIQPYLGVGPGFFYTGMSEFIEEAPTAGRVLDDRLFDLGLDARCGIYVLFKETTGIFLEYRFTEFSPNFKSSATGGEIVMEPIFSTHFLSVGVSFRF